MLCKSYKLNIALTVLNLHDNDSLQYSLCMLYTSELISSLWSKAKYIAMNEVECKFSSHMHYEPGSFRVTTNRFVFTALFRQLEIATQTLRQKLDNCPLFMNRHPLKSLKIRRVVELKMVGVQN